MCQITILSCVNAAGGLHSSNGNLRPEKTKSATLSKRGTHGLSNKGWIDTALFQDPPIRPFYS